MPARFFSKQSAFPPAKSNASHQRLCSGDLRHRFDLASQLLAILLVSLLSSTVVAKQNLTEKASSTTSEQTHSSSKTKPQSNTSYKSKKAKPPQPTNKPVPPPVQPFIPGTLGEMQYVLPQNKIKKAEEKYQTLEATLDAGQQAEITPLLETARTAFNKARNKYNVLYELHYGDLTVLVNDFDLQLARDADDAVNQLLNKLNVLKPLESTPATPDQSNLTVQALNDKHLGQRYNAAHQRFSELEKIAQGQKQTTSPAYQTAEHADQAAKTALALANIKDTLATGVDGNGQSFTMEQEQTITKAETSIKALETALEPLEKELNKIPPKITDSSWFDAHSTHIYTVLILLIVVIVGLILWLLLQSENPKKGERTGSKPKSADEAPPKTTPFSALFSLFGINPVDAEKDGEDELNAILEAYKISGQDIPKDAFALIAKMVQQIIKQNTRIKELKTDVALLKKDRELFREELKTMKIMLGPSKSPETEMDSSSDPKAHEGKAIQSVSKSPLHPDNHSDQIIGTIKNLIGQDSKNGYELCQGIIGTLQSDFSFYQPGQCKTYDFTFKEMQGEYWFYLLYTYPTKTGQDNTEGLLFAAPGVKPSTKMLEYFEDVDIGKDAIGGCNPAIVKVDAQGAITEIISKGALTYS